MEIFILRYVVISRSPIYLLYVLAFFSAKAPNINKRIYSFSKAFPHRSPRARWVFSPRRSHSLIGTNTCKPVWRRAVIQKESTSRVWGGSTPYDGLYGEAPPERGTFFRLQVYERVGKSVLWVCERAQRANRWILWLYKVEKTFYFCDWFLFKRQCIYSS